MKRIALSAIGILLATACVAPAHAAGARYPGEPPSILQAGHSLVVTNDSFGARSSLESPSGVFELSVRSRSVMLSENEPVPGGREASTVTWWQFDDLGRRSLGSDRSSLIMRRDGNLELRTHAGHVVWQSHTHGRGFYLQLQNDGNLVIRDAHHRYQWSSRTTATILPVGRTLASGQTLVNRYREQFHIRPTFLTMGKNGDLVLRWGSRRMWHSGTHSRGAHLLVSHTGRVEIISERGAVVWRSRAVGKDPILQIEQCGTIELTPFDFNHRPWNPTHGQQACAG